MTLYKTFPLPEVAPEEVGLDPAPLHRACTAIATHIEQGYHPGAQLAVARHGKIALYRSFGMANIELNHATDEHSLFLLYSNTKVITTCVLWQLVEEGHLSFDRPIAHYLPGYGAHGKAGITLLQLLTHQAGYPGAVMPSAAWSDHALMRHTVCEWPLEWQPGSKIQYHPASAHWTAAALIEAITGTDYRDEIRNRIIAPLGLTDELFVGLPERHHGRTATIYDPPVNHRFPARAEEAPAAFKLAGVPGGGGYGTARAMAAFYQALGNGGALGGTRLVSPRMMDYVTRNFTADRVDDYYGVPMHRGLGPHSRGETATAVGLGALGHPRTFGHGGVGSSYCWADPTSGLSFAFVSNCRQDRPFHNPRMETISSLVHASIIG